MHGIVNFSGRVAFLISQNTQAFHMFITALLQVSLCKSLSIWFSSSMLLKFYLNSDPIYYCHSYVISLECFMVSLRDSLYICWGSKPNQRRAEFRVQTLHHSRDQASSLSRHQKLARTHGKTSGVGMVGECKVVYVCSYSDSFFSNKDDEFAKGRIKPADFSSDAFPCELEGRKPSNL